MPNLVKLVVGIKGLPLWLRGSFAVGAFLGIVLTIFLGALGGLHLLPEGHPIKEILESALWLGATLIVTGLIILSLALVTLFIPWLVRQYLGEQTETKDDEDNY